LNQKATILFKRITAALLVVLFLFIHVVKVTHHHDPTQQVSKTIIKVAKIFSSSNCAICDYHLAKDGDQNYQVPVIQSPQIFLSSSYFFYNTPAVTSIGSTSSGRGPPVIS
jgi:hypothetical protein